MTPADIINAVKQVDPERNPELVSVIEGNNLITKCNFAIVKLLGVLGIYLPQKLANEQNDWLNSQEAMSLGWEEVGLVTDATTLANRGVVVVASWKNPSGGHGHIMLAVPSPAGHEDHLYVAGAGKDNFNCERVELSFGLSIQPEFFAHKPKEQTSGP